MENSRIDLTIKNWLHSKEDKIPVRVEDGIKEAIFKLPDRPSRINRKAYLAGAVALLLVGITIAGLNSPSLADSLKQIPVIGSLFDITGDEGIKKAGQQGYSTHVDQIVTEQGITLSLKEVMFDGTSLNVAMVEKGDPGLMGDISMIELFIDGKEVNYGAGVWNKQTDTGELVEVTSFTILDTVPSSFDLEIRVKQIGKVSGTWILKTPVTTKKFQSVTREFDPGIKMVKAEGELLVKKLIFAPSTTMLEMEFKPPQEYIDQIRQLGQHSTIQYELINDQGVIFDCTGESTEQGSFKEPILIKARYMPVKRIPQYVIVRPFYRIYSNTSTAIEGDVGKLPGNLCYGSGTRIAVNSIEYLPDRTVVHFEIKEVIPEVIPYDLAACFRLKDDEGNIVQSSGSPVRENEDLYQYRMDFPPVKVQSGWKAATYVREEVKVIEPLQVRIPLDQQKG